MYSIYYIMDELKEQAIKLGATEFGKSKRKDKKYYVVYEGKKINFGSATGQTFLDHKDEKKKENWKKRHSKIVDKDGDVFTNLATANAYVSTFTSATITDESYSNGVYYFTVPNGTSFADAEDFLLVSTAYIIDELGLIDQFGAAAFNSNTSIVCGNNVLGNVTFGYGAFANNNGNNILGNCTFGNESFGNASGINKFGNILLSTNTFYFADNSTGRFEIYGNIGTDETANYANFFSLSTAVIWAQKVKETSNAGGLEGDLATAQTNGAELFFGYATGGGGSTDLSYTPSPTDGTVTSSTGTDATIPLADGTNAGLLSPDEKTEIAKINKTEVKLAENISKGQAVYISSANGTNIIVSKASNATEATSSKVLGLLETTGVTNDIVNVVTFELLTGLDTSSATVGDPVWLGTSGNLIFGLASKPVAPAHLVYIGAVSRVHATQGEIFINIQNGFEINELHDFSDVSYISPIDTDSLMVKDVTNSLWKRLTFANLKTYLNGLYAPKSTTKRTLVDDVTASSNITALVETVAKSYTISANAFENTLNPNFAVYAQKDNTIGTATIRVRMSNTNDFATANLMATFTSGTANKGFGLQRFFWRFTGTNIYHQLGPSNSASTDNTATNNAGTTYALDYTQPIYCWVSIQNSSTGDNTTINIVTITD